MKKLIVCCMLWLAGSSLLAQTLLIANNNAGATTGTNVFTGSTALQDAIAAAAAGDIIYVVPSINNYGDITIDKSLTLFGIGIRPQRDNNNYSTVRDVYITASNVRVSGLEVIRYANGFRLGAVGINSLDGILIENCRFRSYITDASSTQVSNLIIRNNIFYEFGGSITINNSPSVNSTFVSNNIILHTGSGRSIDVTNVTFQYNLFAGNQELFFFDANNCVFDHNIFYGVRVDAAAFVTVTNNAWNYNLAYGASSDAYHVFVSGVDGNTTTGNLESVSGSFDPMFTNFPLGSGTWDNSFDFTLQTGSPALAGSVDNPTTEDMGPSGGPNPFDADGNLLPYIQSITMPAVIPVGNDLPVNIKAKGN